MSIIHEALKKAQTDYQKVRLQNSSTPTPLPVDTPAAAPLPPPEKQKLQRDPSTIAAILKAKPKQDHQSVVYRWIFLLTLLAGLSTLVIYTKKSPSVPQLPAETSSQTASVPASAPGPAEMVSIPDPVPAKQPSLTLNGTMMMGDKRVALINNKIYELGESIDGWQIISISLNKVELKNAETTMTLSAR